MFPRNIPVSKSCFYQLGSDYVIPSPPYSDTAEGDGGGGGSGTSALSSTSHLSSISVDSDQGGTESAAPSSATSATPPPSLDLHSTLRRAQQVLVHEANAINAVAAHITAAPNGLAEFMEALVLCHASAHIIVCGLGKSGLIGQKLSATLSSLGSPSFFLHAAEASHGDLGRVTPGSCVILLSNSGETKEVVGVAKHLREHAFGVRTLALTASTNSSLARAADITLTTGPIEEACPMGIAPTSSTTALLALTDAIALILFDLRTASAERQHSVFERNHPGGAIGERLRCVRDVMQKCGGLCRTQDKMLDVIQGVKQQDAVCVVDDSLRLCRVITQADACALVALHSSVNGLDALMAMTIEDVGHQVGHANCATPETPLDKVAHMIGERGVIAVVDERGWPIGLVSRADVR